MEASRIGFGPRSLPHLRNGGARPHLSLITKLSLFPPHFLHDKVTLSRKTKHNLLCVQATSESSRPLTHFSPTFWGDHFLSVPLDTSEFNELETEIESVLKPKVRNMLMSSHIGDKERIRLIHLLFSLGTSHYFEKEIEEILDHAFRKLDRLIAEEDDLETTAIMLEVFRIHGHYISCDMLNRFKGDDAKFKEDLVMDVRGMLQLYEAAHLGTPSEDIMDEALSFTRYHLESLAGQEATTPPHLSKHIRNALYKPRFLKMEIVAAREYISFFEEEESHDEMLLNFAKLNFNFCQLHYLQELKTLTKWWKDIDIPSKLPYTRDRLVETFLGVSAMYLEPRYSLGRIIVSKFGLVMTVLDDTCDAYGTFSEVRSLIDSLQRWDLGDIEKLPSYLKVVIRSMLETMEDIEREMKPRGRSSSMQYTIEEIKSFGRAIANISKWARAGHVPTFDEYIKVGIDSTGISGFVLYSFMVMENYDEKQTNEWFKSKPKIIQALCAIFRLDNDIAGFEKDMSSGEVANGVNCYMKQHGVTREVAVSEMKKLLRDYYKIVTEEFLTIKSVSRPILVRCLNTIRLINVFNTEGDVFTNPDAKLKDLITSLWWKDIDIPSKLPYTRDRLIETFLGVSAMYLEPRYSFGRIIVSKFGLVMTVLDDTCDAYGTFSEVRSLIDSLQRWDLGDIDELPSYLKVVIRSILETMEDIEREMKPRGRSSSMQYTIEEIKSFGRAIAKISKWARAGHVPTFDEYIKVGIDSTGISGFVLYIFMVMENYDEKQTNEWFKSKPKIIQALCAIFRLDNDIVGLEKDMSSGEVANGVNCYMKQHGVTREVAVSEMKKLLRDYYKIVTEEFLTIKSVSRPILVRCLNTIRLINVFNTEGDVFTNPDIKLKDLITSLYLHPLPL